MGIKFYCPNGHKVNVKSFLAGKKGLCPKCGVRVDIPLQSVIEEPSTPASDARLTSEADDSDAPIEGVLPGLAGPATLAPTRSLVGDPALIAESQPTPGLASIEELPHRSAFDSRSGIPENVRNNQAHDVDEAFLPPQSASIQPMFYASPVWHVQFATGQQVGPLDDAVLQQWLAEGRITPADLIWRAGWPQWQSVAAVFPQLHTHQQVANQTAITAANQTDDPLLEAVQNSLPTTSSKWFHNRHRGKREIRARLSLVLLGLVILLFALLLYVFFMRGQSAEPRQTSLKSAPIVVA